MQSDPLVEWQQLTELYSKMYDDELLELAADSVDLTEVARQVLRDEMKKRGLSLPLAVAIPNCVAYRDATESDEANQGAAFAPGFTWKTPLCECGDREEAWQLSELLRQAGIESWIEGAGSYSPYSNLDMRSPRIMVAADQLEEARQIASMPIPQSIIEQSKMTEPDFEPPTCAKCGAGDPVLEHNDPANKWLCEACGNEWIESVGEMDQNPQKARL